MQLRLIRCRLILAFVASTLGMGLYALAADMAVIPWLHLPPLLMAWGGLLYLCYTCWLAHGWEQRYQKALIEKFNRIVS